MICGKKCLKRFNGLCKKCEEEQITGRIGFEKK
jgi:hypothetical protein